MKAKNIVSNILKSTLVCGLLFGVAACAEDLADKDLFIGAYKGKVTYLKPKEKISIRENMGKVTIGKVGSLYDFYFSNNIPTISGVKMEGAGGKFSGIVLTNEENSLIKIENGHLKLNYVKGILEETWTADCTKIKE